METTVIAAIYFCTILIALGFFFKRMGNLSFWKLASTIPHDFLEYAANDDTWIIEEGSSFYIRSGYTGPFNIAVGDKIYTLFGQDESIKKSQQEFVLKYKHLVPKKPFPIFSLLSLAYPLAAILSFKGAPIIAVLGYGLSNLGYLLAAAFVFGGSFRILGLDNRPQVIIAAVLFWLSGVAMSNI